MKTTFSYFPGMFENPEPAKILKKKSKLLWNINYAVPSNTCFTDRLLRCIDNLIGFINLISPKLIDWLIMFNYVLISPLGMLSTRGSAS